MFPVLFHRYVYIIGILTLMGGLSLSPFLISLGQFILAGNWLFEFRFKQKWQQIKNRPALIFFLSVIIIHAIWLINTKNIEPAINDLKIKLPLLALPIIFSSAKPLNKAEFKFILHAFILSIVIATFISSMVFLGFTKHQSHNAREASLFISHIRFAILVVIGFYTLLECSFTKTYQYNFLKIIYPVILIWFLAFIIVFSASTGGALFFLTLPIIVYSWLKQQRSQAIKYTAAVVFTLITASAIAYLGNSIKKFNTRNEVDFSQLDTTTINGNQYIHFDWDAYENKDLIWIYVCDEELGNEWNKISPIKINKQDERGQLIRHTLIRYLTSKGLRKDSAGISMLTTEDIRLIEQGYTNHIFKKSYSLYPRLYQYFWEIEHYIESGDPNAHSLTMRIEYIINAFNAFRRHLWFGTGTGDVNEEILKQYELDKSVLNERWRYRSHNQYLTFLLTFGIIGFIILVVCLYIGIKKVQPYIDRIALAFLIIIAISMLTEDTLETQAGATITAFFLSLLLFGRKTKPEYDKET